jgi:hypothetical protein
MRPRRALPFRKHGSSSYARPISIGRAFSFGKSFLVADGGLPACGREIAEADVHATNVHYGSRPPVEFGEGERADITFCFCALARSVVFWQLRGGASSG